MAANNTACLNALRRLCSQAGATTSWRS
jgi:hypothetical protein